MDTIKTFSVKGTNSKVITSVPGWFDYVTTGTNSINNALYASQLVPLVHRCMTLRADAIASIPVIITRRGDEVEWPWPDVDLSRLLWKSEAASLLYGAWYWIKMSNTRRVLDLEWVNPGSVYPRYIPATPTSPAVRYFEQYSDGVNLGATWQEDELVYFHEWNPADDINPGQGLAEIALGAARLLHYQSRFAASFFEGGAMPVTILGIDTMDAAEIERVEGRFKRMMTGLKNAWRVLGIRSRAIEPKTLTPNLDTLAMPEMYQIAKQEIATAFGVPMSMLEEPAANMATAESHRLSFWAETIRPRGEMYEDVINRQLLAPMGYEMAFDFNSLDVFQEDEKERAASVLAYVQAGVPLLVAMQILGVDMTEDQEASVMAEQQQKEQRAEEMQERFNRPAEEPNEQLTHELAKWQRIALKRIKAGKPAPSDFECQYIGRGVYNEIQRSLESCKTAEDVNGVFGKFFEPENNTSDKIDTSIMALAHELQRANDLLRGADE